MSTTTRFFSGFLMFLCAAMSAQGQNAITVQAHDPSVVISRHIYGNFAEHLGRCIYGGFYVGEDNKTIPHTRGVRNDVVEALKKLKIPNLSILPAGPIPHNPAKLVISRKMKLMLQTLGERYDHILIDSPPLIGVTDAIILSTIVDGVIVVVHGSKSTREIARRTRQELSNVGANIFGVVLNNIDTAEYQYYQPAYKYIDSDTEGA